MEFTQEKLSPTYDELPEVSQPPLDNYADTPDPREPAGKILTFDTAEKEVVWNDAVSPSSPDHNLENPDSSIVVGKDVNAGTASSSAVGNATELSSKKELAGNDLENQGNKDKESSICGLTRKTFWFVVALAIVVVAAGVGGGVGGGIAAAQSKDSVPAESPSSSSSTGNSGNDTSGGNATLGT